MFSKVREKLINEYGPLRDVDEAFIKEQVASFDEEADLKSEIDPNNFLGTTATFGNYDRRKTGGATRDTRDFKETDDK